MVAQRPLMVRRMMEYHQMSWQAYSNRQFVAAEHCDQLFAVVSHEYLMWDDCDVHSMMMPTMLLLSLMMMRQRLNLSLIGSQRCRNVNLYCYCLMYSLYSFADGSVDEWMTLNFVAAAAFVDDVAGDDDGHWAIGFAANADDYYWPLYDCCYSNWMSLRWSLLF